MTGISWDKRTVAIATVTMLLLAAGAGLWFWSLPSETAPLGADPANARLVTLGETVYRSQCASCHGAKLEGQPDWRVRKPDGKLPAPPHDETGHTWHHADGQLFRLTKRGIKPPLAPEGYRSDMPAFDGVLTDRQIWAVLAYIKSTWPDPIRSRQERISEAFQRQQNSKGEKK